MKNKITFGIICAIDVLGIFLLILFITQDALRKGKGLVGIMLIMVITAFSLALTFMAIWLKIKYRKSNDE